VTKNSPIVYYFATVEELNIVMSMSVCLSVCIWEHISGTAHPNFALVCACWL